MEFKEMPGTEVIKLTSEEFKRYVNASPDDPELLDWMKNNGITFDSGTVEVEIDGVKQKMNTEKKDFGTLAMPTEKEGN